jgi:hypothetical protein
LEHEEGGGNRSKKSEKSEKKTRLVERAQRDFQIWKDTL